MTIAVIGAGASGALQALHLARAGAQVALIERGPAPGRGVAYGTTRPEHLLNVPARRMSAFSGDPDHFTRWFGARGGGGAEDFAPRMLYGDYLQALLAEVGIEAVRGEAVDLADGKVRLADGRAMAAKAVVLAPGNFRPATPRGIDPAAIGEAWVEDPWAGGLDGLADRDVVLLLGTGLTAIDVALTLDATGFRGRIVALSRRGPRAPRPGPREPMVAPAQALPRPASPLLRRIRARARSWAGAARCTSGAASPRRSGARRAPN